MTSSQPTNNLANRKSDKIKLLKYLDNLIWQALWQARSKALFLEISQVYDFLC